MAPSSFDELVAHRPGERVLGLRRSCFSAGARLRERHARAIDAKFDVKLAFAGDYPSLGIRRAITYSKAALFLDLLRQELGDLAFWSGLGRFTRDRAGQAVESRDLQHDIEAASGRDVSDLFKAWVYD